MQIGNEFWGYEFVLYFDAFENAWTDVYIQQYLIRGNNYLDAECYCIANDGIPITDVTKDDPNYAIVAGARMAAFLAAVLDD